MLKRRTLALNPVTGGVRVREQSKRPARSRWFAKEVFDGGGRCPFLVRWTLLSWRGWDVYLHKWIGDDWTEHHHDHSRHMLSIGLWGSYDEVTRTAANLPGSDRWRAPWMRFFRAAHRHRVVLHGAVCWTLILAWPKSRGSFFYVNGERINPTRYHRSAWAEAQKRC